MKKTIKHIAVVTLAFSVLSMYANVYAANYTGLTK